MKNRSYKSLTIIAAASIASVAAAAAKDLSGYEAEAEGVLQRLRGAMMQEMQTAMEVGAAQAISVCRHLAPDIEAQIEAETGWEIRRVSLKPRNSENAPSVAERGILLSYEARKSAGQSVEALRSTRLVEQDGQQVVHFMQATPTYDACLICHGDAIPAEVSDAITKLYPDDQAVGYHVGDIRGAFSLYKPYDPSTEQSSVDEDWLRVSQLKLPSTTVLTETGATVNPEHGRDLFARHCKSCHSAADAADYVKSRGAAQTCRLLRRHGRTSPEEDCDIAGFLQLLGTSAAEQ